MPVRRVRAHSVVVRVSGVGLGNATQCAGTGALEEVRFGYGAGILTGRGKYRKLQRKAEYRFSWEPVLPGMEKHLDRQVL